MSSDLNMSLQKSSVIFLGICSNYWNYIIKHNLIVE